MATTKLEQIRGLGGSEMVRRLTPGKRLERLAAGGVGAARALVANQVADRAQIAKLNDETARYRNQIRDLEAENKRLRALAVEQAGELDRLRVRDVVSTDKRIGELEAELQRVRAEKWSEPDPGNVPGTNNVPGTKDFPKSSQDGNVPGQMPGNVPGTKRTRGPAVELVACPVCATRKAAERAKKAKARKAKR